MLSTNQAVKKEAREKKPSLVSNPGPMGEKCERYLCAMQPPQIKINFVEDLIQFGSENNFASVLQQEVLRLKNHLFVFETRWKTIWSETMKRKKEKKEAEVVSVFAT